MRPPALLGLLRMGWRVPRAKGKMPGGGWLFAGLEPVDLFGSLIGGIGEGALSLELRRAASSEQMIRTEQRTSGARGRMAEPGPSCADRSRQYEASCSHSALPSDSHSGRMSCLVWRSVRTLKSLGTKR
jgi:hypothetical protein